MKWTFPTTALRPELMTWEDTSARRAALTARGRLKVKELGRHHRLTTKIVNFSGFCHGRRHRRAGRAVLRVCVCRIRLGVH